MILRFLLNQVKPSNEQLRSKSDGRFTHLRIQLYQFLLRRLLRTYLHYAISDTIVINSGSIKIAHEFRDLGFESELIRNKIEFKSDMISHSMPLLIRKSRATCNFLFFNFKSLLSLYIDGKELFIKHDGSYSIDGTINGRVRCSLHKKMITQSIIEIFTSDKLKTTNLFVSDNHSNTIGKRGFDIDASF